MKSSLLGFMAILEKHKPYVSMIFIQFIYAGMALLSKAAISKGMSPYVFVVYRQIFASLALSPFAYFDRFTALLFLFLYSCFYLLINYCYNSMLNKFICILILNFCSKHGAPLSCNLLCKLFLVSFVGYGCLFLDSLNLINLKCLHLLLEKVENTI